MAISDPRVTEYLGLVESGGIVACKEQHLLCAHVRKCFDRERLTLDAEKLDKYLSYQKYFPFRLFPWEVFVFALHCCVFRADGLPRWPHLLLLVGRGAGKNGYMAFEDFCLMSPTHGVKHYDIDLCATNEEQAKRTFKDLYEILEAPGNRALSAAFDWNMTEIRNRKTGSALRYRTNNARGKDGLRPGKVDFDEVHEYDSYDNIEVFMGGLGKKPHPRITYATTDGHVRDGVLDDLKRRAEDILERGADDMGLLPFICRLDRKEEAGDEAMWHKANPSLRYMPSLLAQMRLEYSQISISLSTRVGFMTKRMNLPESNREIAVTDWSNILACSRPVPDLNGRTGIVGIDYAKVTDFASAGVLIPVNGTYYWITHSWLCLRSADIERMKCPWREWASAGYLTLVDDVEIAPALITAWVAEQGKRYNLSMLAVDNYRFALMKRALEEIGFRAEKGGRVKLVRPSDIGIVTPVIEQKFAKHAFAYGDNPLMRWAINNTSILQTENDKRKGNFTYGKVEGRSRKNDPFMALVAAMTCETDLRGQLDPATLSALRVWAF